MRMFFIPKPMIQAMLVCVICVLIFGGVWLFLCHEFIAALQKKTKQRWQSMWTGGRISFLICCIHWRHNRYGLRFL